MTIKKSLTAAALLAACLVSACGDKTEPQPSPTPRPTEEPRKDGAPMSQTEIKKFADSFEAAMRDVPPELREPFQKYLGCEIERNNALPEGQRIEINAAKIRDMTAKLKQDPGLASC